MSPEDDDRKKAVDEAAAIFEEVRRIPITIPLGTAYNLGNTLAIAAWRKEDKDLAVDILRRLEIVVPRELIEEGRDNYLGDLSIEVSVSLNYREVDFIGRTALSLPGGREIISALPIDPNDRAELDAFRNSYLHSFLILQKVFVSAGGRNNEEISRSVEEALS